MVTIVVVTGSRNWSKPEEIHSVLEGLRPDLIMHGACPTGADQIASRWAIDNDIPELKFIAEWDTHGRAAGPMRNQDMANAAEALNASCSVICAAFPLGESRGTRDCLKRMHRAKIACFVFENGVQRRWEA